MTRFYPWVLCVAYSVAVMIGLIWHPANPFVIAMVAIPSGIMAGVLLTLSIADTYRRRGGVK